MTIEEAAQDLAERVRSTPGSFSVAIGDGRIVVYQHRRGVRLPVNVDDGWHGFAVQFKWMGHVRPAVSIGAHTPPPWEAREHGNQMADGRRLWAVFAKDTSADVRAGDEIVLCEGVSEADARLIAAAPELLSASQAVLLEVDLPRPPRIEFIRRALERVVALVEKPKK